VPRVEPKTDRQRDYRGQSYAVDLIKLADFGLRATGWRPRDPAAYAIYGEPVLAPCAGRVLAAQDGKPDMPVPELDTSLLEGNHVFIDCDGFGVLLAHLRQGSLDVAIGDSVAAGDALGEAGNSGHSAEPHLHVHAQEIPTDGPLLSGDPLFVTFEGRFLVRNDRVSIDRRR
jgi:murein DD-endopeptidase MepM/ murein hydrolase activator NlpD